MFEVDPERTWVDPSQGPVSSLIQSLNTPLVAAGPHPAEAVQSWIVSRQAAGGGAFEVFVYFHLTESNQAVVYRWDGGPVPPPQLSYVQEEAMSFCESMGFMMDNLNFGTMAPDKRGELLQTLPPFVQDLTTLQREVEEEVASSKKVVDPLEEFQRARSARAESGQAATSDFVVEHPGEPEAMHANAFDPATAPPPVQPDGEPQIEITEIEGLELIPGDDIPLAVGTALDKESSEPPLMMGMMPEATPAPVVRGREVTPAGKTQPMDQLVYDVQTEAVLPTNLPGGRSREDDLNLDDMLAEPPGTPAPNGAADDLSELDSILDGVESSKPPHRKGPKTPAPIPSPAMAKPAAPPKPPPEPEPVFDGEAEMAMGGISIDMQMDGDPSEDALSALESLVGNGNGKAAEPPKPVPTVETLSIESLLGESPAPAPAPAALDSAWAADGGTATASKPANGARPSNGAGKGAPLDIATDDLARLLAML